MKRSDSLSFKSAMAHVVEAPPSASPRSKSPAASLGNETFIIGVTGGTASGKTSVTQRIVTCEPAEIHRSAGDAQKECRLFECLLPENSSKSKAMRFYPCRRDAADYMILFNPPLPYSQHCYTKTTAGKHCKGNLGLKSVVLGRC
eukprot:GHVT01077540.1.p1 GENE.GHVT01077540.1~~GHVT01077540.1.p1  ORF type:complete len:145 (+),score=20.15 GHVT01077540.1:380-814(+)